MRDGRHWQISNITAKYSAADDTTSLTAVIDISISACALSHLEPTFVVEKVAINLGFTLLATI